MQRQEGLTTAAQSGRDSTANPACHFERQVRWGWTCSSVACTGNTHEANTRLECASGALEVEEVVCGLTIDILSMVLTRRLSGFV